MNSILGANLLQTGQQGRGPSAEPATQETSFANLLGQLRLLAEAPPAANPKLTSGTQAVAPEQGAVTVDLSLIAGEGTLSEITFPGAPAHQAKLRAKLAETLDAFAGWVDANLPQAQPGRSLQAEAGAPKEGAAAPALPMGNPLPMIAEKLGQVLHRFDQTHKTNASEVLGRNAAALPEVGFAAADAPSARMFLGLARAVLLLDQATPAQGKPAAQKQGFRTGQPLAQGQIISQDQPLLRGQLSRQSQAFPEGQPPAQGQLIGQAQPHAESQVVAQNQPLSRGQLSRQSQPVAQSQAFPEGQPPAQGQLIAQAQPHAQSQVVAQGQPLSRGQLFLQGQPAAQSQPPAKIELHHPSKAGEAIRIGKPLLSAPIPFKDLVDAATARPFSASYAPAEVQAPSGASAPAAPVASAPAAPSPPSGFAANLLGQVKGHQLSEGTTRIELAPRGLGSIEIDLVRNDSGELKVTIRAENSAVVGALRDGRDALLLALRENGVAVQSSALGFEDFGRGKGQQQQPQPSSPDIDDTPPQDEPDTAAAPASQGIDGRIDIMT
jgi:hypothetical protein